MAAPCSCLGCQSKAFRGTLCEFHYRIKLRESKPLCVVPNCGAHQKNLTSGFCQKHEFRSKRHGSIEQPRPADWGSREQHPLYQTYYAAKRNTKAGMDLAWVADFWAFVAVVGDRPTKHSLRRLDTTKPLGPDNWYWKEPISSADPAKYQRVWRVNNPERDKHHNLKKMYGISLAKYKAMAVEQQGLCAICKKPEMSKGSDGAPRQMPVDHSHVTGKVRALLCSKCNRGLGMFTDSAVLLREAAAYLEKHLATSTDK